MVERIPISKKKRFDVFKRDEFRCAYCGVTPSNSVVLECDHIMPVAQGGENDIDNLVTSCRDCNRGKGATPLSNIPQSLEEKASDVAEKEAQISAYYKILAAKKEREDDELWSIADIFIERFHYDGDGGIQRSRLSSIRTFLEKLNFFEVMEAMEIATDKKHSKGPAFAYFCGICWRKIKRANGEDI
jgi:hypothetical protein